MAEAGHPVPAGEEKAAADEFRDIIRSRSDEREDVQKKTFTKWINAQFAKVASPGFHNFDYHKRTSNT